MNVTIIGTGNMARGIGTRLLSGGVSLILVGHEPGKAEELAIRLMETVSGDSEVNAFDSRGSLPGEVVVLAVPYSAAASVLTGYGTQLSGKIIVDVTNPLNASYDGFVTPPGRSGAEELAALLPPDARLVKAFNTTFSGTLMEGTVAGQSLDVFIAGDDPEAKKTVASLVSRGGLNPVDVGALKRSRQLEELGFLGISLQSTLNTGFRTGWKLLFPE